MYVKKIAAGAAMVGALGFSAVGWVRASRTRHQLRPSWRGLCGSKIEAMGTMGAIGAMAVEGGTTVEAGATDQGGATGQDGAASPVRSGMSPGVPSRGSCGR